MADGLDDTKKIDIAQIIAAYHQAIAADDRVQASRMLECLESNNYKNESDWQLIANFCEMNRFDARLEIITKGLINHGSVVSAKPYITLANLLVKSGRADEARPLLDKYKKLCVNRDFGTWEFINILFNTKAYEECLDEVRKDIEKHPRSVPFLVMEARTLWMLNYHKLARLKLRDLSKHLGTESGNWLWYSAVALEFGEPILAESAVLKLIEMLQRGDATLSEDVIYVLKQAGHGAALSRIIYKSDPTNYSSLPEFVFMFDAAVRYGAYQTAKKFGSAILNRDKNHALRKQIEQLLAEPGFLMS